MAELEKLYAPLKQKYSLQPTFCVDIDDTLAATNIHWAQYHIDNFKNPENLTAQKIVDKYRYVNSVPYWKTPESNNWTLEQLASNEAKKDIPVINGANQSLDLLSSIYSNVLYLTTRPEVSLAGTKQWLTAKRFPSGDVVCEPKSSRLPKGLEWKAKVLSYLSPEIDFVIDDNAYLPDFLPDDYQGMLFLYSHKGKSKNPKIIKCEDWNKTTSEIFSRVISKSNYLGNLYDKVANSFLRTRTSEDNSSGIGHRYIEQPAMFKAVPRDLSGMRLLDIGCGPGIHAKEYLKRGANVYGLDISKEMIALANQFASGGNFSVGNIMDIKDNQKFSIVTSSLVLDHIENLNTFSQKLKKIMTPEGMLIFTIPHPINGIIDENNNALTVERSYFERGIETFSVGGEQTQLFSYKRTLTDYFTPFLNEGFKLLYFKENDSPALPSRSKRLETIPSLCTFKWSLD